MRQIPASDAALRRGEWPAPSTPVLHGKTLGVVGLGRIGRHVARLGKAFGMRVAGWGRTLTDEAAARVGVERRELDDLVGEADVVTIHVSLSPSSRGLLDARRIALMKPTAFLVNTARGPIVDEAALVDALAAGRIAGAGLDVFDREPLPPGHPLTTLGNVVLTPHIGWPTDDGYRRFATAACDRAARLPGRPSRAGVRRALVPPSAYRHRASRRLYPRAGDSAPGSRRPSRPACRNPRIAFWGTLVLNGALTAIVANNYRVVAGAR